MKIESSAGIERTVIHFHLKGNSVKVLKFHWNKS